MTNKVTARKSNPTDTTNITSSAATTTVAQDVTALAAAGLQDICATGNVYESVITVGGYVEYGGAVGNTNSHSSSIYARITAGNNDQLEFSLSTSVRVKITGASFIRYKQQNITPVDALKKAILYNPGPESITVKHILPQLEESAFCTSIIAPAADTAAAQTRAASVVSASTSGVFPMVSATAAQDFAIFMRVVPKGINARGIFSSYLNATNYLSISSDAGGNMISRKLTAGVNDQIITPAVFSEDVVSQIIFVLTKSGISVKYKKNSGAWSSWSILDTETAKLPTVISGTYVIGGRQDIGQFTANYPRTAIIAMPPKATLAEYQAWIEQELTLRGLI
jgi:hypothetical protein